MSPGDTREADCTGSGPMVLAWEEGVPSCPAALAHLGFQGRLWMGWTPSWGVSLPDGPL